MDFLSLVPILKTFSPHSPNTATMALFFGNISSDDFQARFEEPDSQFLTLWLIQHHSDGWFESALESLPLQISSMILTYRDEGET